MYQRIHRHPFCALVLVFVLTPPLAAAAQPPAGPPGDSTSALARAAAADYREAARYPAWSHPIAADRPDPVVAERTPAPHSLAGPDGTGPRLSVWPAEVSFVAPEAVVLYARLIGAGAGAADGVVVTGEVRGSGGEPVGSVTYTDDGVAPDARAGDGVFSAPFVLPAEALPDLAESFLVEVVATLPDGDLRKAASGFLYSNPWARLTGRFRDRVVDGNLVVLAQVEVERAGRFHLQGTLHTLADSPIGWAQTAVELGPGRHWIELPFYGLMFPARGAAGPYRLATVTLSTTGAMPNALGPVWVDAHTTRAYPLASFTTRPFGEPGLLRAADRLEGRAPSSP